MKAFEGLLISALNRIDDGNIRQHAKFCIGEAILHISREYYTEKIKGRSIKFHVQASESSSDSEADIPTPNDANVRLTQFIKCKVRELKGIGNETIRRLIREKLSDFVMAVAVNSQKAKQARETEAGATTSASVPLQELQSVDVYLKEFLDENLVQDFHNTTPQKPAEAS